MSRFSFLANPFFAVSLFLAGVLLGQVSAHAQQLPGEAVNIVTVDGVKLKGTFYPSAAKDAPVVIMLHGIGEGKNMKAPAWEGLAKTLQSKSYAVMAFDFRGHGDSTTIDEPKLFWSLKPNALSVRPKDPKEKETIDVKDYIKSGAAYLPVLVNDIAAVRAYLDRRSDTNKDCNTSSIIVLGAEAGATLGALWINAESYRYKFTPNPMFPTNPKLGKFDTRPEGADIIGAVFLGIQPSLEKRPVRISALLQTSCKQQGMAAAFFYGKEDPKATTLAKSLEKELRVKGSKKHDFIGVVDLDTKLTGMNLLHKDLKTDTSIVDYLDGVVADRKVERADHDFPNTNYKWKTPFGVFPARLQKGEKNLVFDDYNKFMPK
jgi:alpha-beta hydrolase superfamily lysophospholipase